MRVGFFLARYPEPSLTFVTNQITGLLDRGFEVHIFADPPAAQVVPHEDFARYRLQQCIHYWEPRGLSGLLTATRLHFGSALGTVLHTNTKRDGEEALTPERPMFGWTAGEVRNAASYLYKQGRHQGPRWYRRAATLHTVAPLDVAICHFGPVGLQTQHLRDLGVLTAKMVTFFHGYDVSRWLDQHGPNAYDHLFRTCELVAPISQHWRKKLLALGCPEERVKVHRMGIDAERIPFKARVLEPEQTVELISVARLTEKKGLEYALRALAILRQESKKAPLPRFRYRIVGGGDQESLLRQLAEELELSECVSFEGWKTQEEVQRLLEAAHLFLLPSVTARDGDQEGIPVALMEAMAAGLPVVSTEHTGIPELVRHDGGQLLVPERDSIALASAVKRLLSNPAHWQRIGEEGRRVVEEHFSLQTLNDELAKQLHALASQPTSPTR